MSCRFLAAGTLAALAILARPAAATGVVDDFESYVPGAFPSPTWSDAGGLFPEPPAATLPSAGVIATTDAFGAATQALAINNEVSLVRGIYQAVPLSSQYSLVADIRVDQYSVNAPASATDWAMQLTFANTGMNLYAAPQAGIYASSLTGDWRLFWIADTTPSGADIPLGIPATVGTWYRVSLDLETANGGYRAVVSDINAGTTLVDLSGSFVGWAPGDGQYDAVAFIGGEGTEGQTVANIGVVDNINVVVQPVPVPAAIWLLGSGLGMLGWFGRRRRIT
jgi:hypothetical protein